MNNKKNKSQKIKLIAIILFAIIIINSIVVFFYTDSPSKPKAFLARNMNDASYDCEEKIQSKYGDRLVNSYFDSLSSRYEAKKHRYLIYYRISIREDEGDLTTITEYMAKCLVWERLGYVSDFSVFEP
jgi:uncharacterized protein YpmS